MAIVQRHGSPYEQAYLFPCRSAAVRCIGFVDRHSTPGAGEDLRIIDLYPNDGDRPTISAVILPISCGRIAKAFWQHTGEGISSRRAEYCHKAFSNGHLTAKVGTEVIDPHFSEDQKSSCKGPKRYRKGQPLDLSPENTLRDTALSTMPESRDYAQFVEERFGRNLDLSLAEKAKLAIRRRIAGALTATEDLTVALDATHAPSRTIEVEGFGEDDVYLFPCGMNAIFHSHRALMACRGQLKSVSYGYVHCFAVNLKFGSRSIDFPTLIP